MLRNLLNKIPRPKHVLVEQVQTGDNLSALEALRKMQGSGWTQDGTLAGLDLQRANLENARLARAEMAGVILREANLQGAYFGATNLREADLQAVNLNGANLGDVQLSGANLAGADLSNAHLASGDLRRVNLTGANLEFSQSVADRPARGRPESSVTDERQPVRHVL